MERSRVDSSSIASVGYDAGTFTLEVEFHNGRVYRYSHVPAAAYRLLMQASSLGSFMNKFIRPRFTATRVDDAP